MSDFVAPTAGGGAPRVVGTPRGGAPNPQPGPNPNAVPAGSCDYPWGQCTWYVASQYTVLQKTSCLGDACHWWERAKQNAWYTNASPFLGAVVVWTCSLGGSGGAGHVAIITKLNQDGSFDVKESNWQGLGVVDTRTVRDRSGILGYFAPPGVVPGTPGQDQQGECVTPAPAVGARGLPCLFGITIPGFRIQGPLGQSWCAGGWSFCLDGLVGVLAFGAGLGVIVLAVMSTVQRPAERVATRGAEGVAVATGNPAAATAAAVGRRRQGTHRNDVPMGSRQEAREQGPRQTSNEGPHRRAGRPPRAAPRRATSSSLSVQQRQTRQVLVDMGFTSVQATRGARAAGSGGTIEERTRAGLRELGQA